MARASRTHAVEPQPNTLRRGLDGLGDSCVVAFAVWTLFAYVAMATGARVSVLFPLAVAAAALAVAALLVLRRRSSATAAAAPERGSAERESTVARRRRIAPLAVAAAAAAAVSAVVADVPWAVVWLFALVAVALALAAGRFRSTDTGPEDAGAGWAGDVVAVATGLALAVVSLFVNNPSPDDVFYVNRATATAQLDRIPVKDVIVTHEEAARSGGTGLPLDSYAALHGAVAQVLDVHAASVAYFLVPPAATFLAIWALWRLVRAWAPRAALLCFVLGCVYWVWSTEPMPPPGHALVPGNYFVTRIWQGKVTFVAWMVPTLYVLLTRWLRRTDVPGAILLVSAAVASLGLTGSAAIAVPLIVSAAIVAAVARYDWPQLPVLGGVLAIPVVAGLAATAAFPLTVVLGAEQPTEWYYQAVFGTGVTSVVVGLAIWSAPWVARRGAAAALTTGVAVVALVVLAPGVIDALHDILGLQGSRALRRTLWVVPIPAVVGLLAAAPVVYVARRLGALDARRRVERVAVVVPALVVAAVVVASGRPSWSEDAGSRLTTRPVWKVNPGPLRAARAILARYDGPGPILSDKSTMHAISILTAETKTVNPRTIYAQRTLESRERIRARLRLTRFARPGAPPDVGERVPRALALLEVELVCVHPRRRDAIRELMEVAPYRSAFSTGTHACVERTE